MRRKDLLQNTWGIVLTLLLLVGCSPQAGSTPSGLQAGAPPADTQVPPTATASQPTETPVPPTPTAVSAAGKTFKGPLGEQGEISFTVSADGLSIDPGMKLSLKDVSCAEGGSSSGYSKLSMEITLPANKSIPIQAMQFKYGSDNMFEPGYGMELIGQFDSADRASGTFKYTDTGQPLQTCTYGPYPWTANTP